MTGKGNPQSGLTALLDALERELLAAPAEEVRAACRERGRARHLAGQEVRALLNEAITASEDDSAATVSIGACDELDRLFGVSRTHRFAARDHPGVSAAPAWSSRRH